jgi:hypothetical protein
MTESWSNNREVPDELLWKDVPAEKHGDLDFIIDLIDWDANADAHLFSHRFTPPVETAESRHASDQGWVEKWITCRSPSFSAKELTLRPGTSVVIADRDPYGLIAVGGRGTINGQVLESSTLLRYGQLSSDEFFVGSQALNGGVTITNQSPSEDLVILKHFGPGNVQLAEESGPLGLAGS